MNSLQSPLFASAITVCLFSAGLLRDKERRTGRPFAFFLAFLFAEVAAFVFELLGGLPHLPLKALWLGLWMDSSLLVAPCLWLAVREGAEGRSPDFSGIDRRHGYVVLAGIALTLPLIATSNWGLAFAQPGVVVSRLHSLAIHATMLACIGIFAVQAPFYLWRCRRVLLASPGASGWLALPLVVVATGWVIGILRTLQCVTHGPQAFIPWFSLVEVGVTVGAMYLVVRRVSHPEAVPAAGPETFLGAEPPAPGSRYLKSRLDLRVRERIKGKLAAAMGEGALYRDCLLSLQSLSRSLKENPHYVSQVISQDLDSSFYALINRHRIQEAARLLAGDPGRTILEIGLSVGFNSKSTFNAAFRANLGMTPSAYRAHATGDRA